MAGLGFKDFQVGEVLTSADVDGYLMQQTVMRFADAGARGSALGTAAGTGVPLAEGMVVYLEDVNRVEAFTGTEWVTIGPDPIERVGTDSTIIQVDDAGVVKVADATSPTPVVRPLPFGFETGSVTGNVSGSTVASTTVTFTADRFTSAPAVIVGRISASTNAGVQANTTVSAHTVSTTGFTLLRANANAGTIGIGAYWLAIQ